MIVGFREVLLGDFRSFVPCDATHPLNSILLFLLTVFE